MGYKSFCDYKHSGDDEVDLCNDDNDSNDDNDDNGDNDNNDNKDKNDDRDRIGSLQSLLKESRALTARFKFVSKFTIGRRWNITLIEEF